MSPVQEFEARPELKAYLLQSIDELIGEKSFNSREECSEWIAQNFKAVVQNAIQLQYQLLDKVSKSPEVKKVMGAKVWQAIKIQEINDGVQKTLVDTLGPMP